MTDGAREYLVVVVGKASEYATWCDYAACYIEKVGTIIVLQAGSQEEAKKLGEKFGRVKEVKAR